VVGSILLFFYKKKRKQNKKSNKILPVTSACCGAVVRNECRDHFSNYKYNIDNYFLAQPTTPFNTASAQQLL